MKLMSLITKKQNYKYEKICHRGSPMLLVAQKRDDLRCSPVFFLSSFAINPRRVDACFLYRHYWLWNKTGSIAYLNTILRDNKDLILIHTLKNKLLFFFLSWLCCFKKKKSLPIIIWHVVFSFFILFFFFNLSNFCFSF